MNLVILISVLFIAIIFYLIYNIISLKGEMKEMENVYNENLKYLTDITESIARVEKLEPMISRITGIMTRQLHYKFLFIFLTREITEDMSHPLKCIATPSIVTLKGIDLVLPDSAEDMASLYRIMNSKKPGIINLSTGFAEKLKNRQFTAIPIMVKNESIGIILTEPIISAREMLHLMFFANQVGLALENAKLYDKTEKMSMIDELTKLYNFRYFQNKLAEEIELSKRYKKENISLAMIDIDDFKQYNDLNGHPAGDACLKQVSHILSSHIRSADVLVRYGGEEFCIIYPATDKEGARIAVEKIRQAVENFKFEYGHRQPGGRLTISAGISNYTADAYDKDTLIDHADKALYEAKKRGKNQVCIFE